MTPSFDLYGSGEDRHGPDVPLALTIAGSDSGGGAGIQADLKTFAACRVFGTSVLTLITAQNTVGVSAVSILDEEIVAGQFAAVMADLPPGAAKTGALGSREMIAYIAGLLDKNSIDQLVVDPVMISKHGAPLLPEEAYPVLRDRLLPHALVVTPNRFEASALTGGKITVETVPSMKEAAKRIYDFGARRVVIKGGHFDKIVRDIYFDGSGYVEFGADRVDSPGVHGSGCTFSAAITAALARGQGLLESVGFAREFISGAIEKAPRIGKGIAPVNPMHEYWS